MRIFLTWLRRNYTVENILPWLCDQNAKDMTFGQDLCGKPQLQEPLSFCLGKYYTPPCNGF